MRTDECLRFCVRATTFNLEPTLGTLVLHVYRRSIVRNSETEIVVKQL